MSPGRRADTSMVRINQRTLSPWYVGVSGFSAARFGSAKQVWPVKMQVAHPSLVFAALTNARFSTGRSGGPGAGPGAGGGGDSSAKGEGENDAVTTLIDKYGDAISQLSFSGTLGFASGYAMVKVGKVVAFGIGIVFVAAQGLSYAGVIDIKWGKIRDKTKKMLDTNNDGKLDKEDVKNLWKRLKEALTYNLPAGGGFASGFALGLYCG